MVHTNNITSLVLIALAVVLGASLLAVAMTPPVYASHDGTWHSASSSKGCTKDKGNPALHNPNCGIVVFKP